MHRGGNYVVCVIMILSECYDVDMLAKMEQAMKIIRVRLQH